MLNIIRDVSIICACSIICYSALDNRTQGRTQTALLQKIVTNTTQPIHTETTIAKVDEGVCSTLVNALGKSGNGKKGNGK